MNNSIIINDLNYTNHLTSGYFLMQFLNEQEAKFRNEIRLTDSKYRYWVVDERKQKILISAGEKYKINITVYYNKLTKKKFIYYHHPILEMMKKKRYLYFEVIEALKHNTFRRRNKNINSMQQSRVPYDIFYYWNKINYLKVVLNNTTFKEEKSNVCQIENDDTYFKIREQNETKKQCLRMVGIHKNNQNKTLILQFKNAENKQLDYQNLVSKTQEILQWNYHYETLNLSGDGAKIINVFANDIKAKRHYDKYHFLRDVFNCFGYSRTKNKDNRKLFDHVFGDQFLMIRNLIYRKNYSWITNIIDQSLEYIEQFYPTNLRKIKEIKNLKSVWKHNQKSIILAFENPNYFGNNAETFIGHYIKNYIHKPFAIYKKETIKRLIAFKIPKNINLFFI